MSIAARRSHRGDEYQIGVAVHWLIQLLTNDRVTSVEVEAVCFPNESDLVTVDDVVISYTDGIRRFIQSKKNQPDQRAWAFSDAVLRDELVKAFRQSRHASTAVIEFWSHTPFGDLAKLIDAHNDYADFVAFEAQAPNTLQTALRALSQVVSVSLQEAFAWSRALHIGPHLDALRLEERNRQALEMITTDAAIAFDVLERLVRRRQTTLITLAPIQRSDLVTALDVRGVSVIRASMRWSDEEVHNRFASASGALLSWRSILPDGQWLERVELDALRSTIADADHSVTLVLGDPGSGKSALLARLGQSLCDQPCSLLAVKADQLPEDVVDRCTLAKVLELPDDVIACVRALARTRPVIVLIDQLDALADLVVQHSGRLRVLLQLVRDLSTQNNVHVIASSRAFEHRHDPRLKAIDADVIKLALPTWQQVSEVLAARGISATAWSESIRDDLRSPHALDLFLQLVQDIDSSSLLAGYQQMLDALWSKYVLSDATGRRRAAVVEVASVMADREVLWLPQTRFDDCSQAVNELIAAGILVSDRGRLGFRHQTLYEFVRARDFVDGEGRLTEAVLERQHSVRVRPLLWHALGYMRSVNPVVYQSEIERLWMAGLRSHLHGLLIDFMGQAKEPLPAEIRLILRIAEDAKWCPRILMAMGGSSGWFAPLRTNMLPTAMMQKPADASPCLSFLVASASFKSGAVRTLIDRHWLPDADFDFLTWAVLDRLPELRADDVDRICTIVGRSAIAPVFVSEISARVSDRFPAAAPKIVRAWLDRLERDPELKFASTEQSLGAAPSPAMLSRLRNLLTGHELYDLPLVAEAAPAEFLNQIWPWFLRAILWFGSDYEDEAMYRREQVQIDVWDDERAPRERPVIDAILNAIEGLAHTDAMGFIAWANQHSGIDQMIIQRLLAHGMMVIAAAHPHAVLEFLLADRRRLLLGSFREPSVDSKKLIGFVMPHLEPPNQMLIESLILDWNRWKDAIDDDAKTRLARLKWNREHRLRLLRAISNDCLSVGTRKLVVEEERALEVDDDASRFIPGMTEISSPITAGQMALARDEHILEIFDELDDTQDWGRTSRRSRPLSRSGGAIQAGRELEKLTKTHPERGARIALELVAGKNEIPAGFVVRALSEARSNTSLFYSLVEKLIARGFKSPGFVSDVARAVQNLVDSNNPPPSALIDQLTDWLRDASAVVRIEREGNADSDANAVYDVANASSFLWSGGSLMVLPGDNYPLLSALSHIFLSADPPQMDKWMTLLEERAEKKELSRTWGAMASDLVNLHLADRARAIALLDCLVRQHPDMFASRPGAILLGYVQRWAPSSKIREWIAQIRRLDTPQVHQIVGEVTALHAIATKGAEWSVQLVEEVCSSDSALEANVALQLGVAFAVAELWQEPLFRRDAHSRLVALFRNGSVLILRALGAIFDPDCFGPDSFCRDVLELLTERPAIGAARADRVAECLLTMVEYEPERVSKASLALLDACHADIGSLASSNYLAGETLVTIAMALQEQGGEVAMVAAELFDRILEFRIPYADELLLALDKRTTNTANAVRHVPRRRRRSRRRSPA